MMMSEKGMPITEKVQVIKVEAYSWGQKSTDMSSECDSHSSWLTFSMPEGGNRRLSSCLYRSLPCYKGHIVHSCF